MKKDKRAPSDRFVPVRVLQRVAARMIPFYRRIASNRKYAAAWTVGVRRANLTKLLRLLQEAGIVVPSPGVGSFSTNGIGYFVDFSAPAPIGIYTNGTSLRPGTTQFYFNTRVHRMIARAVLPLYRKMAFDRVFAARIVRLIRTNNTAMLNRVVRNLVTTSALRSVTISSSGFKIGFKYAASPFVFYNQFFREISG
ncbi:hypothetical protein ACFQI7_30705 [Paenibacillus allorhizosphaerae]|uniref:Uncharacterized protein n=1 Tax=Paenibacillus allorhizosphaerae TaxID=2849866 RepID=A0ABM8VPQ7_9BACL|nr:hypothetical protein [Paenibacillus allorhizosphaerae]CAG7653258.1 hypothetical protein PAECIP111802_05442 [Paenibacillus allorhizosphaerae]